MSLQSGYTTWATEKKRFTGFILLSIAVGSLAFSWIKPRWAASVVLALSCCTPRTLFISSWGLTSMVTPSEIWTGVCRLWKESRKKAVAYLIERQPTPALHSGIKAK